MQAFIWKSHLTASDWLASNRGKNKYHNEWPSRRTCADCLWACNVIECVGTCILLLLKAYDWGLRARVINGASWKMLVNSPKVHHMEKITTWQCFAARWHQEMEVSCLNTLRQGSGEWRSCELWGHDSSFLIGSPQKDSGKSISFRNAPGKGLPFRGKWGSSSPYLFGFSPFQ